MRRVVLVLSCALWLSGPLWAQEATTSQPGATYTISAPELTRLLAISTQLKALSVSLSDKLTYSQTLLQSQSDELKALKLELVDLRLTIEQSSQLSEALKVTLAESEASLSRLQISFDEYKSAATKQIKLWQGVAAILGGVSAISILIAIF